MLANRQAPISCAWLRSRRARKGAALLTRPGAPVTFWNCRDEGRPAKIDAQDASGGRRTKGAR
jgi:hypothetical protein